MKRNYVQAILENLKDEGNIKITFTSTIGHKYTIRQEKNEVLTCFYNDGNISSYYTQAEDGVLNSYTDTDFGSLIKYADNILYVNVAKYTVEYL